MDKSSGTSDVKKEIITVDTARKLFGFVLSARGVDVPQTTGNFETNDIFKSLNEKSTQMTQDIWAKGKSSKIQEQLKEFLETGKVSGAIKSIQNKGKKYIGSVQSLGVAVKVKIEEWSSKGRTDLLQGIKQSQAYLSIQGSPEIEPKGIEDDAR